MPIVLPNEGLPTLLGWMLRDDTSAVPSNTLILFSSDTTPTQATVYADLTEAGFTGYSPVTIDRATWTSPVVDDDHAVSTWDTTPILWLPESGPQIIYGYAVVTPSSPVILWCERFATPITVEDGGVLALLPRFALTTEP
jgi:hypothetical protein